MKKKSKKILNFIIIISLIFSTFVIIEGESYAFASPLAAATTANADKAVSKTNTQKNISTVQPKATEIKTKTLKEAKKFGFKYSLYKFFTAMFCVLISTIAIFLGLKIYKNIILKNNLKADNLDYEKNLESPKNFKEAINLFLDKTDK